jgi:hypothetical protein
MLIDHVARLNGMDMEVEAAKGRDGPQEAER